MAGFDNYLINLDEFGDEIFSSGFDVSRYLLSEDDVVKNLLKSKHPELSDEDITDIIESTDDESTPKDDSKLKKERRRIFRKTYGNFVKDLRKQAKTILRKIREAIFILFEKVKEISQKVATAAITTVNSIPAIITMIAAPPWNISAAVLILIGIIEAYILLLATIKMVYPYFEPTRELPLVTNSKNLKTVSNILDPLITTLRSLFKPILALNAVIQSLLDKLIETITKSKNKTFRQATKRLKKLGHIRKRSDRGDAYPSELNDGEKITVYSYDADDVDEISQILSEFKLDGSGDNNSDKVVDFRTPVDVGKLEDMSNSIKESERFILNNDVGELYSDYLYDVELPDGSRIYSINDEALEEIKNKYLVKFVYPY
jgi:hypothetical protein